MARLRRNFAKGSLFPNYEVTRVDTFHQFLYPQTYFGWLSFIPRIGFRGTYYSETGHTEDVIPSSIPDLVQPTPMLQGPAQKVFVSSNAVFRGVIDAPTPKME